MAICINLEESRVKEGARGIIIVYISQKRNISLCGIFVVPNKFALRWVTTNNTNLAYKLGLSMSDWVNSINSEQKRFQKQ